MRCQDLTRELEYPTGAFAPAEVAEHLASCTACAERSLRADRFDRIWEATRPSEPSMDALDALWARASVEIDARAAAPATLKFAGSARRRWATAAFLGAQAAAILLAALFLLRRDSAKPVVELADATAAQPPAFLEFKVEEDEETVVQLGKDNKPRLVVRDRSADFNSPWLPEDTPFLQMRELGLMAAPLGTVAAK